LEWGSASKDAERPALGDRLGGQVPLPDRAAPAASRQRSTGRALASRRRTPGREDGGRAAWPSTTQTP